MAESFSGPLLDWFDQHGRHDLPWQQSPDPYRVWVSEIMLQQTRVDAVIGYYERFIAQFPDLASLAAAPLDDVLSLWAGLGYYARARNLHRAAGQVIAEHHGRMPEDLEALMSLPGIGRSTAGAIRSLGFDLPAAILDGNVKRVLARRHAVHGWPGTTENLKHLWTVAQSHLPDARHAHYTQAIMDLGATLCTPRDPDCAQCPVSSSCLAREQGLTAEIPAPKPKKRLPERATRMLIATTHAGEVLLQRRPESGIWGGLWSFPELLPGQRATEHPALGAGDAAACWEGELLRHTFTHFHLNITPVRVALRSTPDQLGEDGAPAWCKLSDSSHLGTPAPVRLLLNQLNQEHSGSAINDSNRILQEA